MITNPKTIDEYLAGVPDIQRAALEHLRETIKAVAPGAEECISYHLPAFRFEGRMLVAFGAAAHHLAFYPMSAATIKAFQEELTDYSTNKGTIRFQPEHPLPDALVRRLVEARVVENRAK